MCNRRAEGPQRRPDGSERSADAAGGRPDQQGVAEIEGTQPDRQLAEQDDRCLSRQDPVAPPVAGYWPNDQPEDPVHGAGHHASQPAAGFARHYDGSDHAYHRAEHEQRSGGRRDITYRSRGHHQGWRSARTSNSLPSGSASVTQVSSGRLSPITVAPSPMSRAISSSWERSVGLTSRWTRFLTILPSGTCAKVSIGGTGPG